MAYHVISIPKCALCLMAKNLLTAHGLEYTEEVLDTDKKRETFKAANPTIKVMPQIYEEGVLIGSWSNLRAWLK